MAVPSALAGADGGVAYFAHIGGFIAGMCLVLFFKRSDVPLFGANDTTPKRWDAEPIPFSEIRQQARYRYSRRGTTRSACVVVKDEDASPWAKPPARKIGRRKSGSVPRFRKPPEGDG